MINFKYIVIVVLASFMFLLAGCGPTKLQTKGRVIKDGQPFIAEEGEYLQVTLIPVAADGSPPKNFFYTEVDQKTGTFFAAGPDKMGVPPGKYKAAINLKKGKSDKFKGAYEAEVSVFVFDIDSATKEIVIDLDKQPPPAKVVKPKRDTSNDG